MKKISVFLLLHQVERELEKQSATFKTRPLFEKVPGVYRCRIGRRGIKKYWGFFIVDRTRGRTFPLVSNEYAAHIHP